MTTIKKCSNCHKGFERERYAKHIEVERRVQRIPEICPQCAKRDSVAIVVAGSILIFCVFGMFLLNSCSK